MLFFRAFFLNWIQLFLNLLKRYIQAWVRLTPIQFSYMAAAFFMLGMSLMPWLAYNLEFFEEEQKLASSLRWFFFLTAGLALSFFFLNIAYKKIYVLSALLLSAAVYLWGIIASCNAHNPITIAEGDYSFSASHWLYGLALGLALLTAVPALRQPLFQKNNGKVIY